MKNELLQEGWVEFRRYRCLEGYIDCWSGDCANDPNRLTKSLYNLNAIRTYFRLNNGEWVESNELGRAHAADIHNYGEPFTAEEIWNEWIRIETKRRL